MIQKNLCTWAILLCTTFVITLYASANPAPITSKLDETFITVNEGFTSPDVSGFSSIQENTQTEESFAAYFNGSEDETEKDLSEQAQVVASVTKQEQVYIAESGYVVTTSSNSISSAYSAAAAGGYVGTLKCAEWGMSVNMYYTNEQSVCDASNSACLLNQVLGSYIIGDSRGGAIVADHNNQAFSALQYAQVGDLLYANMTYGQYVYKVTEIVLATSNSSYTEFTTDDGRYVFASCKSGAIDGLVLYTCYPFGNSIDGRRYLVICELVEGTTLY